jgi:hypothetical protein
LLIWQNQWRCIASDVVSLVAAAAHSSVSAGCYTGVAHMGAVEAVHTAVVHREVVVVARKVVEFDHKVVAHKVFVPVKLGLDRYT